jgi:hypothetical protein
MESAALQTKTDAFCLELEQLEQQVKAKSVSAEDAKERWELTYRPEARTLALEILHALPDENRHLMMVSRVGDRRSFKADVLTFIDSSFFEGAVLEPLHTVRKQLRSLISDLSSVANA